MAPVCQGDESFGQYIEVLLQSRVNAEVGMLIGRPGNRDAFLLLLPTPHEGNTAPVELQSVTDSSSKKNKKAQPDAQVQLAVDTITEHAAQVAAMLPGGLSAMGLYLYGPEAAFANATICEFKLVPSLSGFSIMTCRHAVRMTLPILDNMQALSTNVEALIAAESVDLLKADLVSSLQARLDIIMAEAEEALKSTEAGGARHAILQSTAGSSTYITLRLPTRVFFLVQDTLSFCDYLASGESITDATCRLQPLLGKQADLSQMQTPEGTGEVVHSTKQMQIWTACPLPCKTRPWMPCNLTTTVLSSAVVAFSAAAVAFYSQS
ncbi:hypothetical protein WJX79_002677 [Trebouxia sp. C0005]